MDLRNNEDDRPYRGVNRAQYNPAQMQQDDAYGYDDTMTTQAYYRERLRGLTEQRWFPLAAVTAGVILFGTLIAFAYRQGADTNGNGATPLIQAENGSYKEKPQTPGGMDVPFQDAVVFDQLDAKKTADAGGTVENLLPPPEQPVDAVPAQNAPKTATDNLPSAPQASADKGVIAATENDSVADKIAATEANLQTKTGGTSVGTTGTADTAALQEATAATMQISSAQTAVDPALVTDNTSPAAVQSTNTKAIRTETVKTTAPAKTATVQPAAKKPATTVPTVKTATVTAATAPFTAASATPTKMNAVAPAAPTPAPAKTGGTAKVQLGAFKDEAAAKAAWASLQKQYAPHLNGVAPNYARADLGAKGVFYRVQGVNLSSAQAKDICTAINATKPGACIIPQ